MLQPGQRRRRLHWLRWRRLGSTLSPPTEGLTPALHARESVTSMTLSVSDTDRTQKPHKSRSPEMFLKSLLFGKVCAVPPFFLRRRLHWLEAAPAAAAAAVPPRRGGNARPLGPLWQSVTEAAAAAGDGSDKCTTYSTKNDPPAIISESFLHKKLELVPLSPYRHPLPSPSGGGSSWQSPTWRIRPRKGAAAARADPLTTGRTADGVAAAAPTANVEPARECVCAA